MNFHAWYLATRPKTLPAASAPVIVGTALAIGDGVFSLGPFLAALAVALLLQIGSNIANDVFDFKKGTDTEERVGPLRVTQAGLISPREMFIGLAIVMALALVVMVYLMYVGGWPILAIGILAIISAIIYTGGPFPIGYNGLGEIFVFIFFGPVAVCGTYYVQALGLTPAVWIASVPIGFLIMAILVVNNYRDYETDRKTGKKTLAVRFGPRATEWEYILFLFVAYLVPVLQFIHNPRLYWLLLPLVTLVMGQKLVQELKREEGPALNLTLAKTAKLGLFYAVLYAIGYLLASFLA